MLYTFLKGFLVSGGLIMAIGAQNAFVIRQGLMRNHLLLTALCCAVFDAFLIALGVLGFGQILGDYPLLMEISKYCAIAFLVVYGGLSLKSAFQSKSLEGAHENRILSRKKLFLILIALSLLNPHAYLDAVVLLGGIAAQQPDHEQIYFAIGAIGASFLWFFSITYGSSLLAPLLKKEKTWKWIDSFVAMNMWGIAGSLLFI